MKIDESLKIDKLKEAKAIIGKSLNWDIIKTFKLAL